MEEFKQKITLGKLEKTNDIRGWEYAINSKPMEDEAMHQLTLYISDTHQYLHSKFKSVDRPSFFGEVYYRYGEKQKMFKFYKMEDIDKGIVLGSYRRGEVVGILIIDFIYE